MRHRPTTLHFCGHANAAGELLFESTGEGVQHADISAIAWVFDALPDSVRCVVLNCCHSDAQAREIAAHVEVVIGMRGRLSDTCGVAFAEGFYEALGFGHDYLTAFELALLRLELESLAEDERPILYTRGQHASLRTRIPKTLRKLARGPARTRAPRERAPRASLRECATPGPDKPVLRTLTIGVAGLLALPLWAMMSVDNEARRPPCPAGFARTESEHCVSNEGGDERVFVPAGAAFLGLDGEMSSRRRVALRAFAIGRTEVSVAQYLECVDSGSCSQAEDLVRSEYGTPSSFRVANNRDLPANYLDWDDARAYCRWAGGDLCTSAQWEKAALGGCELHPNEAACESSRPLTPWGAPLSCEYAAFNDRPREDPGCRSHHPDAALSSQRVPLWPVDSHPRGASPYGALNMIGNVWEWTADSIPWRPGIGACPDCKDTRGGGVHSSPKTAHASTPNPAPSHSRWAQRGARCCWDIE